MEFSFDRSKESQSRRTEESPQAQAASAIRPGPDLNTQDPSTIANERLRKAIERNRAKQADRSSQPRVAATSQQASFFSSPSPEAEKMNVAASASETPQQETPTESPRASEIPNEAPRESLRMRTSSNSTSTSVVSRRSVAKPDDTEFVPVKRTTRKVASQISYTTNSTRKKPKSLDPKYTNYLVKGSWIFCGIMVLRLIFAAGGVTDYYSQKNSMNDRFLELNEIKKENMQIVREIERMRSDIGFQKKLVRDNLGFIASDEFLVLFPKEI